MILLRGGCFSIYIPKFKKPFTDLQGAFTIILAFAGILGDWYKDRNVLGFYLTLSSIILVLNFTVGVGAFVAAEHLSSSYTSTNIGKSAQPTLW